MGRGERIYFSKQQDLGNHACFRLGGAYVRLSYATYHLIYLTSPNAKKERGLPKIIMLYSNDILDAVETVPAALAVRQSIKPMCSLLLRRRRR